MNTELEQFLSQVEGLETEPSMDEARFPESESDWDKYVYLQRMEAEEFENWLYWEEFPFK